MQMARMAFLAVAYKGNPCLDDRKYENEKICVGGKVGGLSLMVSNFTTFCFFSISTMNSLISLNAVMQRSCFSCSGDRSCDVGGLSAIFIAAFFTSDRSLFSLIL